MSEEVKERENRRSRWSKISSRVSRTSFDDGREDTRRRSNSLLEDISQGNYDNWIPDTCVQLLRMPSVQNYAGITKLIGRADKEWMSEFLELGGLDVLFESLARLSDKSFNKFADAVLQLECVSCVKAVMNSRTGLDYIVFHPEYTRKLAKALDTKNTLVKKQVFELMSAMCVYAQKGHILAIDALQHYQEAKNLRYRFSLLINELKTAEVLPYAASIMAFVNCIIVSREKHGERVRVRNEFIGLGLLDVLSSLRHAEDDDLFIQCHVFDKTKFADDEHSESLGIESSTSHYDLFQNIFQRICDTPQAMSFLFILGNLAKIDSENPASDLVWTYMDRISEKALNAYDRGCESFFKSECILNQGNLDNTNDVSTQTENGTIYPFMMNSKHTNSDVTESQLSSSGTFESEVFFDAPDSSSVRSHSPDSGLYSCITENSEDEYNRTSGSSVVSGANSLAPSQQVSPVNGDSIFPEAILQRLECKPEENGSCQASNHATGEKESLSDLAKTSSQPAMITSAARIPPPPPLPGGEMLSEPNISLHTNGISTPETSSSNSGNIPQVSPPLPNKIPQAPPPPPLPNKVPQAPPPPPLPDKIPQAPPPPPLPPNSAAICSHPPFASSSVPQAPPPPPLSPTSGVIPPPPPPPPPISCTIPPPPPPPQLLGEGSVPPPPPPPPPASGNMPPPPPPAPGKAPLPSPRSYPNACSPIMPTAFSSTPRPKTRMKTLNWTKVPQRIVSEGKSLWNGLLQEERNDIQVNYERVEELFCQKKIVPKEAQAKQKKEPTEVTLLDNKRSLNVNIFLKQFKCSDKEFISYIEQCEADKIGAEKLRTFLKILPDKDEIDMLNCYKGEFEKLGKGEKFILRLSKVKFFSVRVEGMLQKEEFRPLVDGLKPQIFGFLETCEQLLNNEALKEFLRLTLMTGNFMNAGSYAGGAFGFRLNTLPKLMETRANKPRMTLLHYLVEAAEKEEGNALSFISDFKYLSQSARLSLDGMNGELRQLRQGIRKLASQMDNSNDEQLQHSFSSFIENSESELCAIENNLTKIKSVSNKLAQHFCEDESTFKVEECISLFNNFCEKVKSSIKENHERIKQEERAERLKKAREQQEAERKNKKGSRSSISSLTVSDGCIVDQLLGEIRKGSFKLRKTEGPGR